MEQALIFGGLSPFGFPISERLLEEGVYVMSVSSAVSTKEVEQEEENEFFLGRNVLFRSERQKGENSFGGMVIADTFRLDSERNKVLKDKIRNTLASSTSIHNLLFLSSLEVLGESDASLRDKVPVHPVSAIGNAANKMELFFVHLLREIRRKEAIIFRTDLNLLADRKKGKSIAALINGLLEIDHEGLDVVHYKSGQQPDAQVNEKIRGLLPDRYKTWL